jgi:hypothetical protein
VNKEKLFRPGSEFQVIGCFYEAAKKRVRREKKPKSKESFIKEYVLL